MEYLVGSRLLNLNNKDTDKLVIVNSLNERVDYHYSTLQEIDDYLNFKVPFDYKTVIRYLFNYQYDAEIIEQNFPIEHHILENKINYINLLVWIIDNRAANFIKTLAINNRYCSKLIYHIAYIVFILENNSTTITSEQKEIIQKIHDIKMPMEYLDELEQKIRTLAENLLIK